MIEFDHVAITTNNLEETIAFYEKIGYEFESLFSNQEYRWATLKLGATRLEIFEPLISELPVIQHIAYRFNEEKEVYQIAERLGYKNEKLDIFSGDLNRKSFFIEDNNGISIQFIKINLVTEKNM